MYWLWLSAYIERRYYLCINMYVQRALVVPFFFFSAFRANAMGISEVSIMYALCHITTNGYHVRFLIFSSRPPSLPPPIYKNTHSDIFSSACPHSVCNICFCRPVRNRNSHDRSGRIIQRTPILQRMARPICIRPICIRRIYTLCRDILNSNPTNRAR